MKFKKKILVPIIVVAVIGVAAAFAVPKIVSGAASKPPVVSVVPLERMDLESIVSVTGTVKSEDATNVYSTLANQVQNVNVKVGDRVNEGDVLCVLDTSSLTATIEQQSASLANNQAKVQHNLAVAQNNLATEKYNQDNNFDEKLQSAEKAIEGAEIGVETAKQKLEAKKSALEDAKLLLLKAQQSQNSNRKALKDYKESYGTPKSSVYDPDYDKLFQAVAQGEISITQAENAVADAEKAVEDAKKDVEIAKKDVDDAKASFTTVQVQKKEALESSQQDVTARQLDADLSDVAMQLEEMKKDLDKAIIKAPVSGVVTAVLATEGSSGQGLLFVIEDTEKLKIDTKIKEYDIASVKVGQQAKIKSDGTGDKEYDGKVSRIAPTAVKANNGDTIETTDVQFETEVGVSDKSDLKIGMNARIDIITEEKANIFAVPYDSVIENENGENIVFVARPQTIVNAENGEGNMPPVSMSAEEYSRNMSEGEEGSQKIDAEREKQQTKNAANNGGMIAVAVPVKFGMETDFYIEIMSDSLKEGDLIISNPADLTDGQLISLDDGAAAGGAAAAGGGSGVAVRVG